MPLKQFICPDGTRVDIQDCLREGACRMGDRCATRSYLQLASRDRPWTGKPSTTQLIAGTMHAYLKIIKDYAVSPDQRAFMIHGTKAHMNLEDSEDEYSILEEKFNSEDTKETGISDVIEREAGKNILADYKTSGSYKVAKALGFTVEKELIPGEFFRSGKRKGEQKTRNILVRKQDAEDRWEWELQLNKYRIEAERKFKIKFDELRIQCIVRDGNTYIAKSRGVFRNVYYFKIKILPDQEVLEYFKTKREALYKALQEGRCDEICTAKENWNGVKCVRYCEVAAHCKFGKYLIEERKGEDMAIKGMSEIRRLPRLGKIRLGIKAVAQSGKEYPKEVDYFVLDPQTPAKEENDRLIQEFHRLYGEKPKKINVMFPVPDPEVFFPQYYKRYGSSTSLQCKGDGAEAICIREEFAKGLEPIGKDDLGLLKVKCLGRDCSYYKANQCSECGTLQVLLPELPGAGVWQITTGSFHSIVNVNSCIDYVRAVAGRAHMIPLTLERRGQEIAHEGKKTKHYILHINMDFKLADLQKQAMIEPSKIMLELPAAEPEKEDILFGQNAVIDVADNQQGEIVGTAKLNETDLVNAINEIKACKTREEISELEKRYKSTLTKEDVDYLATHIATARHVLLGERLGKTTTNQSANGYGDAKRFGTNQAKAIELIERIKAGRSKLGEERFSMILGSQGWTTVAEITAITPLQNLLNAMIEVARK